MSHFGFPKILHDSPHDSKTEAYKNLTFEMGLHMTTLLHMCYIVIILMYHIHFYFYLFRLYILISWSLSIILFNIVYI